MKKLKLLMKTLLASSFLLTVSSTAVASIKLTEMPKQFQGKWNNGEEFDGFSYITLGKNWIKRETAGGICGGNIIQIEELAKDHIRILSKFSCNGDGAIYYRSKDWIGLKIANGKLKLSVYNDGWHTKTNAKVSGSWKEYDDIWKIPVSLNKALFIQRLVTSIYGHDNLETGKVIDKNGRYFIKTGNGIKQIGISDRANKRYVEIPDVEYEGSYVFTFTKKGNQWHLDKQEQKQK